MAISHQTFAQRNIILHGENNCANPDRKDTPGRKTRGNANSMENNSTAQKHHPTRNIYRLHPPKLKLKSTSKTQGYGKTKQTKNETPRYTSSVRSEGWTIVHATRLTTRAQR